MSMWIYIKIFFRSALFYLVFILISFWFTGKTERVHQVAPADSLLVVKNEPQTAEALARQYQPSIWIKDGHTTTTPSGMYFEVIDQPGEVVIVYHTTWAGEDHPSFLMDIGHKIFRFFYLRSGLFDSAFIQVHVDKTSGAVTTVAFEGPESPVNFYDPKPTQKLVRHQPGEGKVRPVLEIANWQHLFTPLQQQPVSGFTEQIFSLTYLDSECYANQRYVRLPQGDFYTDESPANLPIIFFVGIIFSSYLFMLQFGYHGKYGRPENIA